MSLAFYVSYAFVFNAFNPHIEIERPVTRPPGMGTNLKSVPGFLRVATNYGNSIFNFPTGCTVVGGSKKIINLINRIISVINLRNFILSFRGVSATRNLLSGKRKLIRV